MSKKIAISFDDAPAGDGLFLSGDERTSMLLEALQSSGVEATFFVATHDFAAANSFQRIAAYNDAGHLIASHTNSHPAASDTEVATYLADVDTAVGLLDGFSNYRSWFRYPFLDEGTTEEVRAQYRDGMAERGIQNGYVTADTFDWYLENQLASAISNNVSYDLDAVRDAYVDMILTAANHFETVAQDHLGRTPIQSLLLHENDLAAMFIDDAIAALRADGWEIVSSDETYADPIADIEPETLMTGRGRIAALAIDNGADFSILDHDANTTVGIDAILARNNVFDNVSERNLIEGSAVDDVMFGTAQNDEFIAKDGNDTMVGSIGDDIFYGGEIGESAPQDYDQVNYQGALKDYVFSTLSDGGISVKKPDGGVDKLYSIEGFWFFGEEAWYSLEQVLDAADAGVINGTDSDDYILGTDQSETINGLEGSDVFEGSAGNDKINGGGTEYDQVDYDGALLDYAFSQNADGSISVSKPDGSVDTLTNIDGVWFNDEEAWYSIDQALSLTNSNVIIGTPESEYIDGSDANDVINGLSGQDVIAGSTGSDIIDGGGSEYDQVDYEGRLSDYKFAQNEDGSVSVLKPDGSSDLLTNIDGFWFLEEQAWYSVEQVLRSEGDNVINGTSGDDYILGTSGQDVIYLNEGRDTAQSSDGNDVIIGHTSSYDQMDYAGVKEDYTFSLEPDDRIKVVKPNGDFDLLESVEGFWFSGNKEWVPYEDLIPVI